MTPRHRLATLGSAALLACAATVATSGTSASASDDHGHGRGIIVWTHRAAPGSEHLMVARADGSHARRLTQPRADTGDIDAQVSPDGRWVAYEKDEGDSATLHLVRPSGRGDHVVDVGCTDPCVAAVGPTWLSNERLAFALIKGPFDAASGAASSAALWTSRRDGSDVRRLSPRSIDGKFEDSYLRVSRDHTYLTFRRFSDAVGAAALFRMDRHGRHVVQLTPYALNAEVNDLSTARRGPTRDLVVFESFGRGDPDATFVDLATVPATCPSLAACTSRIVWLTDNAASGRRNANPQWSPDGRSLVFTDRPSVDVEDANIFTMRFGGHHRTQVSTSAQFDYRPAWGVRR
jgi:Tol biopolymer transport system component